MDSTLRRGRAWIALLLPALTLASCEYLNQNKDAGKKAAPPPKPVDVSAIQARARAVPLELSTFGTVAANAKVDVRAQVSGLLIKAHVRRGQNVRKGDKLFDIDPKPYQLALAQAEATLARDRVQEANARKEVRREEELSRKGISATSDYDKALTLADSLAATLRADQAAIDRCKLDLGYCEIVSPIDGRAGDLLVDEGNLVRANEAILISLNQIQPVEVFFALPQRELPRVQHYFARQPRPRVQVRLGQDLPLIEEGDLTFLDNQVDTGTGTIRLGASLPNKEMRLWPGQYVHVKLILTIQADTVVVPQRTVQTGRDGKYVFVVTAERTAELRPVEARRGAGDEMIIDKGLAPGEQVVSEGHIFLTHGKKVALRGDKTAATGPAGGARTQPASAPAKAPGAPAAGRGE